MNTVTYKLYITQQINKLKAEKKPSVNAILLDHLQDILNGLNKEKLVVDF